MKAKVGTSALVALALGCAAAPPPREPQPAELSARLYDLETGAVSQARFLYDGSGAGPLAVTMPDGQSCAGEYSTVAEGWASWGRIFTTLYDPLPVAAMGTRSESGGGPTNQRGTAIATCGDWRVIQCEYVTASTDAQGHGACEDNREARYRLMF